MADVSGMIEVHTSSAYASMLVQMLEQEGVRVDWEAPIEHRSADLAQLAMDAVVGLVVSGSYDAIKAGVRKFITRTGGRARVDVHVDPEPDPKTED